ncbi:Retrovirus-related Pol polyprotein from transposon TNT 1-94 [Trichinella patagoniensis]|uniref:Retrovirus-related Pol polyprotein from transposon TNT 1-94 n=1 Tax=Trichinella patagoniensis TaxID=990121 RepID=A0A0V0ZGR3_9BILA|nr:Retrovirus-related Pol polyprotein from transposon TNT 1-94 [Trichinella patagoniensis]
MSGMATEGDLGKPVIAKLNSSNYQLWKLKMKVLLMRDGLWDLVSQPKPCPIPEDWSRKECKAIAAICLTVENLQPIHQRFASFLKESEGLYEICKIGNKYEITAEGLFLHDFMDYFHCSRFLFFKTADDFLYLCAISLNSCTRDGALRKTFFSKHFEACGSSRSWIGTTQEAKQNIELIHSDICGPMPTATPSDHRYMMTFIDDYSRFTVVYLLKTKDEAVDRIKYYVATLHTKFGRNPVTLRTDNGREYVNQRLRNFLREKEIEHQFSSPYAPQKNGVAERKNRALVEMAKCMLTDAKLPECFWGEAVCTAAYLQNRLPSRSISKTPFELWTGIKPNVEHIRIFRSKAYSYIPKQKRRKWDNKAREGVIVGYGGSTKGYRLLNPRTNEIWISRSVKIIEDDSHIKNECAVPKGAIERSREYDDISKLLKKEDNVIIEDIFGQTQEELSGEVDTIKDGIEAPTLRRSRRINKCIPPKRLSYNIRATQICEPKSWEEVIKLPARERNKWIAAAEEEMTSLKRKGVFELVEPPDGCNVISSKWIFKAKRDASGKIHSYKARLVARGFSQRLGEDYDETFAPVVKHETIRTLLSIAAVKSHFDVKCAYLNAEFPEKLYMEQPPGFEDTNKDMVWQLKRRIYGLKQSARAWNTKAREILTTVGFRQAKADLCLYTRKEPSHSMTYVLLYVDDLLIAAENEAVALTVNKQLNKYIEVKGSLRKGGSLFSLCVWDASNASNCFCFKYAPVTSAEITAVFLLVPDTTILESAHDSLAPRGLSDFGDSSLMDTQPYVGIEFGRYQRSL